MLVALPSSPVWSRRTRRPSSSATNFLTPPAWESGGTVRFLLGTDDVGRDILSRLIYGARLSLLIGAVVVAFRSASAPCWG